MRDFCDTILNGELLSHHEDHEGHEGFAIYIFMFLNFVLFASFVVKCLFLLWFGPAR